MKEGRIKLNGDSIRTFKIGEAILLIEEHGWMEIFETKENLEIGYEFSCRDWEGDWKVLCLLRKECSCENCTDRFPLYEEF